MIDSASTSAEQNGEALPAPRSGPTVLEWWVLVAGVVLVLHLRWLLDDAFIYFRYVDNFLFLDLGLVFNRGEYVEGFTSPLWTLCLIALRSTELDYGTILSATAVLLYVAFWSATVALGRETTFVGSTRSNLPLVALTGCYAVQSSFTSGVETALVMALAPAVALFALRPEKWWRQCAVAIAPLVRPELAIVAVLAVPYAWWRSRRFPWRLVAVTSAFLGSWLVFRVTYYAELLPNTFYLKDVSEREAGWRYLQDTAVVYHWHWWMIGGFVLAGIALARRRTVHVSARVFLLLCAAIHVAYVVRIGGDARHFRYLAFPFCLSFCALAGLLEGALAADQGGRRRWPWALAGVAAFAFMATLHPRQLSHHPWWRPVQHVAPLGINDAELHRQGVRIDYAGWARKAEIAAMREAAAGESAVHGNYTADNLCLRIYGNFGQGVVHSLGLTDSVLARCDVPVTWAAHRMKLIPLAEDLAALRNAAEQQAPGMIRAAVDRGDAPAWVIDNLDSLERIERRMFNEHDFWQNLRECWKPIPRLQIPADPE